MLNRKHESSKESACADPASDAKPCKRRRSTPYQAPETQNLRETKGASRLTPVTDLRNFRYDPVRNDQRKTPLPSMTCWLFSQLQTSAICTVVHIGHWNLTPEWCRFRTRCLSVFSSGRWALRLDRRRVPQAFEFALRNHPG